MSFKIVNAFSHKYGKWYNIVKISTLLHKTFVYFSSFFIVQLKKHCNSFY